MGEKENLYTVYSIGDRVTLISPTPDDNDELFVGVGGTVCGEDQGGSYWVPVCWDIMTERGHDCNGECEFGYGWNVSREDIVPEKIREIRDADIAELSDICSFIGIGRCEA